MAREPVGGGRVLELTAVARSYPEGDGRRTVLEHVDVRVEPGECVAVIGPSGSGKSTLLNIASGIDAPDAGHVVLDGVRLDALGERARTLLRRRRVGFVFQFFNLLPTLTVAENVRLPLELNGVAPAVARRRAVEALAGLGLADRADAFPDRLSGGEQQRVAVLRALVHGPSVVFADEPTGNLDRDSAAAVLDLLVAAVRDHGASLLMVTHSDSAAARADRVLAMRGGALVPADPVRAAPGRPGVGS
ncbi:MAG: ABC transporter ATP-binding protein [Chromatiales bacterium]|nr:ABC transporter ATP-binding protein [Chromatiales bacterium]